MKPLFGSVSRRSTAPPEVIWELLTDVTRMGEWSPECTGGQWLDGASQAVVGARFRGSNRWGPMVWTTICQIEKADKPSHFAYGARHSSGALTRWSYELSREGIGTLLTERFQTVGTPTAVLLIDRLLRRPRKLAYGMTETLSRLSAAAERRST
ncbi:SRPBCC family protein [Mycolicibacter sinensis]|uniref:SRPBCC family protein n=1 Tax=Mycolicibacter sinensis (strain JDM601) TaxID=875328 RepID=UPI0009EF592C